MSAGVSVGAIGASDLMVELHPSVQPMVGREPFEGTVIAIAHGEQSAFAQYPSHLKERVDWSAQVLEHLVRVDDVEDALPVSKVVNVADDEADVARARRRCLSARDVDDRLRDIHPRDHPRRDESRQVDGDRPGAAAHVQ